MINFEKQYLKQLKVSKHFVSKTNFCKILECTDNTINILIILEGINNDNPSICGILSDILGTKSSKI